MLCDLWSAERQLSQMQAQACLRLRSARLASPGFALGETKLGALHSGILWSLQLA